MPSGGRKGPENSKRTRRDLAAAPITWSAVRTSWGEEWSPASGSPGGADGRAGCGGTPAALTLAEEADDHGKHVSSKYTSDVTTTRWPGTNRTIASFVRD
eukprot:4193637-Pleurochrysis_carterae.AAC.1